MKLNKIIALLPFVLTPFCFAESYQSIETKIERLQQLTEQGKEENAEYKTLMDEIIKSGQITLIFIADIITGETKQPTQKYVDTLIKSAVANQKNCEKKP